jgi:hypothetical protein
VAGGKQGRRTAARRIQGRRPTQEGTIEGGGRRLAVDAVRRQGKKVAQRHRLQLSGEAPRCEERKEAVNALVAGVDLAECARAGVRVGRLGMIDSGTRGGPEIDVRWSGLLAAGLLGWGSAGDLVQIRAKRVVQVPEAYTQIFRN